MGELTLLKNDVKTFWGLDEAKVFDNIVML